VLNLWTSAPGTSAATVNASLHGEGYQGDRHDKAPKMQEDILWPRTHREHDHNDHVGKQQGRKKEVECGIESRMASGRLFFGHGRMLLRLR
jgi:hypothetical protein